jgi:hypothetical protein
MLQNRFAENFLLKSDIKIGVTPPGFKPVNIQIDHPGQPIAHFDPGNQFFDEAAIALDLDFNLTGRQIADIANQAQLFGFSLDKPAETNPLNQPLNDDMCANIHVPVPE